MSSSGDAPPLLPLATGWRDCGYDRQVTPTPSPVSPPATPPGQLDPPATTPTTTTAVQLVPPATTPTTTTAVALRVECLCAFRADGTATWYWPGGPLHTAEILVQGHPFEPAPPDVQRRLQLLYPIGADA